MRQALAITLSLLIINGLFAQTEEQLLQEAIQVVRDFVGDQSLTPLFTDDENRISFFEGPYREFRFGWVPGFYYIYVRVSPSPMFVVGWGKADEAWLPYVNTNLPEKSDNELLALAQNYASQHFPGWQDFPHWQGKIMGRIKDSGYGKTVRSRIITFCPYFVNDYGDKIVFAPAGCSVRIEPYEGNIIAFHWLYNLRMTLSRSQLNPTLTPLEAEAIAEQKVRDWVAQILAEEGYSIPSGVVFEATLSDPNDPDQGWWGDSRLVIGATETSGLRLAYRVDKIQAKDANAGEVLDQWIYALIDAHTGEVLRYPDRIWSLNGHLSRQVFSGYTFRLAKFLAMVSILVSVLFVALFLKLRKKRPK